MKIKISAIAAAVAAATLSMAADAATIDFNGYGRSGIGGSDKGGGMVCYNLGGNTATNDAAAMSHFRLGNECDTYLELGFDVKVAEKAGSTFKLHTMLAGGTNQIADYEMNAPAWRQLWVEATNVGSGPLANTSLWAGKRYYRQDIHMLDLRYIDLDGPGAGIDGIDVAGVARLSYHLNTQGGNDDQNWDAATNTRWNPGLNTKNPGSTAARVHALRLEGIALGENGGSLDFYTNFGQGSSRNNGAKTKSGFWFTGQHTIGVLGGFNRAIVQYAKGGLAIDGESKYWLNENADYKGFRVLDHFVFDIGQFNGSAVVGYQQNKDYPWFSGAKETITTAGLRGWYHFNELYAVGGEVGAATWKNVDYKGGNAPTARLQKVTVSGQLAPGKGFWTRPALRAYYTYAHWNDQAYKSGVTCTGRDCGNSVSLGTDVTSGSTWGMQAEAWW